jgi:tetratricopeptide (TPR) repeat protein
MPLLGHPAWGAHAEGDVLVARGVLAYHENRYDDAIDALSRAIAVTPDSVRAHYYLGLSYRERGQLDAAILALTRALEIDPNNADVRYQLGVTYLLASNYDQAHIHLESVFRERPNESLLAYYVGFLRFQKQDYTNAAKAFEVVQTEDPRLSQLVAFYRGMSLGYLGLSEQAIAQLEQVPRIDSTDIITGPTLRIRDVLATPANVQNRFRATLSVGGYYDDNVAVNPNASNDPIAQFLRERKTTSPGLLTSLQTEFSFLRKGPVEAALNYSFFQTVNLNDHLNDFNIQDHSGGLSTYYRGTFGTKHPYQVALQYTYGYLFLGEAGFLSRHIVSFSPTFVLPDFHLPLIGRVGNTTSPIALYQINNFFREVGDVDIRFGSDIRDGFNATGGLLHLFRFADDAFILRLGYRHDEENTKGSAFSYSGNRAIAGGQVTLPWGKITLRYDYDLHWRDYKYAQSLFPNEAGDLVPRYDMQKTHVVQLSKLIGTHWTATLQYQHLRNDSNIPVYNYTKNVFTALLSWTY